MARRRASSERDADTALRRRTCRIAGHGGGGRTAATATVVVPDRTAHPEIRVGQADRERVVGRLCAAVGEGRLTLDEAADRQAAAYAARFPRDLAPLLVDLPTAPPDRDVDVVHVNGAPRTHLRQALRTILMINGIALCVGLSAFPGAAGLVALLSAVTIMLAVVAAECTGGFHTRGPRGRRRHDN